MGDGLIRAPCEVNWNVDCKECRHNVHAEVFGDGWFGQILVSLGEDAACPFQQFDLIRVLSRVKMSDINSTRK